MNIDRLRRIADRATAKYKQARVSLRREKKLLAKYRDYVEVTLEAQTILQTVAAAVQTKAHEQITKIVTSSLRTVFGNAYEFKINFTRKRGKTQARMCYFKNGIEIDPVEDDSGGVLDVAAFALRLSCLLLATPRRRKLLILDEPFKHVHGDEYRERAAELLEVLAKDLKVQIIIATGLSWLQIGKVVRL